MDALVESATTAEGRIANTEKWLSLVIHLWYLYAAAAVLDLAQEAMSCATQVTAIVVDGVALVRLVSTLLGVMNDTAACCTYVKESYWFCLFMSTAVLCGLSLS